MVTPPWNIDGEIEGDGEQEEEGHVGSGSAGDRSDATLSDAVCKFRLSKRLDLGWTDIRACEVIESGESL